jgi:hypothetical protein
MEGDDVSLQDYQGGFLGGQAEGAMELLKAMQAGQITGRDTANQSLTMEPLKAESLETTLKLLEYRQKDIRLLNRMPKLTAYNTVEEFLQLESYGQQAGGFYNEGELSDVQDSSYVRRASLIKYIQVTGEVTMQAQMVRSFVDAMRQEVENKTMWIQRRANIALTQGNSNTVPQEFDSLYVQHANIGTGSGDYLYPSLAAYYGSNVVIDLRGESLKQIHVEEGAVAVDANYGNVSDLFAPTSVISTLSQDYFASQRIMLNAGNPDAYKGQIGTVAKSIATTIGDVALQPDKFINKYNTNGITTATPATSNKAPSAPTATSRTLVSDAGSSYQTGDAGAVYYGVTAFNRYGESAMVVIGASVTLAAAYSVDLIFTATAGAYAPTGYRIYRTLVGGASTGTFYPLFDVAVSDLANGYDGAAALAIRDRGRILPNTETAFLTEMVDDVLSYKQLAPISKLDLAIISMSRRFIAFSFATPQLYTPKKFVKFVNCGKVLTNP